MKKNIVKLLVLAIAVMSVMLAFASCGCSHEEETIPAVAATCTEAGATEGTKCKLCGEVLVAPVPTEATGHNYQPVDKVDATCTTDGYEAGSKCACGAIESGCEVIAAAHKPADIAEQAATCTTDGVAAGKRCTVCAENLEGFEVIPATGHTLTDVEAIAPSCTVAGCAAGKQCSACDYSEGFDTVPATGHTEKAVDRVEPTCTEDGAEAGKRCAVCNEVMEGCAPIAKLGHTPGEITVVTAATLGKVGAGTSTCTVCKAALELVLPAIPGGEWNYTSATDTLAINSAFAGVANAELVTEGDNTYVKVAIDNPGLHPGSPAEGDKATKNKEVILSWKPDAALDALNANNQFVFKTKVKFDEIITKWTPAGTQFDNTGTVDKYYQGWLINFCLSTNPNQGNASDDYNIYIAANPVLKEGTGIVEQVKIGNGVVNMGDWVELTFVFTLNASDSAKCDIVVYMDGVSVYTATQSMKKSVPGNAITDFRIKFKNTRVYDKFVVCFDDTTLEELPYCVHTPGEEVTEVVAPQIGVAGKGTAVCTKCGAAVEVEIPALPEPDFNLTVEEAIALGQTMEHDKYTADKYYVSGVITEVYNTTYGNMKIKDEAGNILTVYGTYSADGSARYDAMATKPVAGDTVTVFGIVGQYNGTSQVKNGWIVEHTAHTHDYAAATCVAPATCTICAATEGEALAHTYVEGVCSGCGKVEVPAGATGVVATFQFGANGDAAHVDGNDLGTTATYTDGDYTLKLTGMSKVYGPAYDAKGNSAIKLGTSSKTGEFSFTVADDITEVTIMVACYKANATKVNVNGTDYTLSSSNYASNNGSYMAIVIDTTTTKTVNFKTVSGGVRAMIDSISFAR